VCFVVYCYRSFDGAQDDIGGAQEDGVAVGKIYQNN
jgi:hypothetical protein